MEPGGVRRRPQQVAAAAENPDRLRPAADRLRRAGRTGDVPGQAAARPQPAAGDRPHQPPAARDEQAHRRGRGLLRRVQNLTKALNFDENIREEALIDWDKLKATVPGEVARCMESFKGITIADTRECLLAALRAIKDPDAAKIFEHNFKSLERLWEAVSPDPVLYDHRYTYSWLCSVYIAHRRRQKGASKQDTYGELSAKTRALIEENTTFMDLAELVAGVQDRQGLCHQT